MFISPKLKAFLLSLGMLFSVGMKSAYAIPTDVSFMVIPGVYPQTLPLAAIGTSFTGSVGLTITLPKFDAGLGTLTSMEIQVAGHSFDDIQGTNHTQSAQTFTSRAGYHDTVHSDDPVFAGSFDAVVREQEFTYSPRTVQCCEGTFIAELLNYSPNQYDFTGASADNFIGSGDFTFDFTHAVDISVFPNGNGFPADGDLSFVDLFRGMDVFARVVYFYDAPPPIPTPTPSTGWLVLTGAALLLYRKRRSQREKCDRAS